MISDHLHIALTHFFVNSKVALHNYKLDIIIIIIRLIIESSYIAHKQCSVRCTCTISTSILEHTALAPISALETNRTHCHLCPTRYSFTPESSEACEGKVPCPRTKHRNNVSISRREKHEISLKILHQAGFETAR